MAIRLRNPMVLLLGVASLSACVHGARPKDLPSATSPAGTPVELRIKGETARRNGELFAVDDSGLIVHTSAGRLLRVGWNRLEALQPGRLSPSQFGVALYEIPQAEKRRRLALVSRFPQGLSGQLLEDVLRTLKQESLDELPPMHDPDNTPDVTPSLEAFAATAATAAARYADRRVAIADGYRRIGADFPAMGEHWLRTSELLADRLDPERPTMLTYAIIDGRPMLVGTGFVVTTRDDEPAQQVPGWPAQWHEHSGALGEESGARPIGNDDHDHSTMRRSGTRAWVLHIWTTLENPAGRYHADNWALPFARAGLSVRGGVAVDEFAGRALSLAVGGDRFLRDMLTDAGMRSAANAAPVDSAIARARVDAEQVLAAAREAGGADSQHLMRLQETWQRLQTSLMASAGPVVTNYLTSAHHAQRRE